MKFSPWVIVSLKEKLPVVVDDRVQIFVEAPKRWRISPPNLASMVWGSGLWSLVTSSLRKGFSTALVAGPPIPTVPLFQWRSVGSELKIGARGFLPVLLQNLEEAGVFVRGQQCLDKGDGAFVKLADAFPTERWFLTLSDFGQGQPFFMAGAEDFPGLLGDHFLVGFEECDQRGFFPFWLRFKFFGFEPVQEGFPLLGIQALEQVKNFVGG